jgi:ornithine decarboxylase
MNTYNPYMKIYTPSLLGINIALMHKINSNSRWIYDKSALINQANKWSKEIPWIKPYYAVKSNPLPYMVDDLIHYKCAINEEPIEFPIYDKEKNENREPFHFGLDVASIKETNDALKYTTLENTIYTNPHTIAHEIDSNTIQYNIKVVDSVGELELLHKHNIKCPILIRMNSGVNIATINFNSKFGASRDEAYDIVNLANKYNYEIKGVSFHIGSGGTFSRKESFQSAYYINALPILKYIQLFNKQKLILNIGGGFLYNTDLKEALGWTKELPFTMIAEPGRYFSEPSHHLAIQVIAINSKGIFLDNGVYHELNCFHRDHWTMPKLIHVVNNGIINNVKTYKQSVIFGPTCDSYDTIGTQDFPLNIEVGDWILLPNMGAYTNAGAVNFNGIKGASTH